ncbi:MAG TPA: DUF4291 domain-containing protein, partial [Kofleriaceae bacterium]|nr:DUF4291 domain-containing protein [Kofleriaceae bacterium]
LMAVGQERQILADHDEEGIWVYQAFRPATVAAALAKGTFGKGFTMDRITWIKPSFGWMLYRSHYASRPRQEAILRIKLRRSGFDTILRAAVPTAFEPEVFPSQDAWGRALRATEVRVQWDPDRDLTLRRLPRRAIQLGLEGSIVQRYVHEWIVALEDATPLAHAVRDAIEREDPLPPAPIEREYPVDAELERTLGMRSGTAPP